MGLICLSIRRSLDTRAELLQRRVLSGVESTEWEPRTLIGRKRRARRRRDANYEGRSGPTSCPAASVARRL